jgi:hypothetical protein
MLAVKCAQLRLQVGDCSTARISETVLLVLLVLLLRLLVDITWVCTEREATDGGHSQRDDLQSRVPHAKQPRHIT